MASEVGWKFRDQYKIKGRTSEAGRLKRAKGFRDSRHISRADEFSKHRDLTGIDETNSAPKIDKNIDQRRLKLQKWKEEKEMKKMLAKKAEKPQFIVPVVFHKLGSPYLRDVSNMNHVKQQKKIQSSGKVQKPTLRSAKPNVAKQKSFAPANFKFKAPQLMMSEANSKTTKENCVSHPKHKTDMKPTSVKNSQTETSGFKRITRSQTRNKIEQVEKSTTTRGRGRANKIVSTTAPKLPSVNSKSRNHLFGTVQEENISIDNTGTVQNVNVHEENVVIEDREKYNQTMEKSEEINADSGHPVDDKCNAEVLENDDVDPSTKSVTDSKPAAISDSKSVCCTPDTGLESEGIYPIHYSPFVTQQRGSSNKRSSIRKSIARRSINKLAEQTSSPLKHASDDEDKKKHGIVYFRSVLQSEILRLKSLCNIWREIQNSTDNLPQEAIDLIDTAIGQTDLLITKKFCQFRTLIDRCERGPVVGSEEPAVTCTDLDGFWDMTFKQVENLDFRFNNLTMLQANNWIEEIIPKKKGPRFTRTKVEKKKHPAQSSLRAIIAAARRKQKLGDAPLAEGCDTVHCDETVTEVPETAPLAEGCDTVPCDETVTEVPETAPHSSTLRKSLGLRQESSPIIMRVSQIGKLSESISTPVQESSASSDLHTPISKQTPKKSILKLIAFHESQTKGSAILECDKPGSEVKNSALHPTPRRSARKVRFEASTSDSPKMVQPMTPFAPHMLKRTSPRYSSDRLSFLGSSHNESPSSMSLSGDLICFNSPVEEPQRIRRRSARLSQFD